MRRCCLRKRYGRFKLPTIRGATTSKARRKDVNWLARTDSQAREVEFSEHFGKLSPDDGSVSEVIGFSSALSTASMTEVFGYLGARYGVAIRNS